MEQPTTIVSRDSNTGGLTTEMHFFLDPECHKLMSDYGSFQNTGHPPAGFYIDRDGYSNGIDLAEVVSITPQTSL